MAQAPTLTAVLVAAARDVGLDGGSVEPEAYARAVVDRLHAAGYAIHALDGRCVRVSGEPPGRQMTIDEQSMVGLA